MANWLVVHGHSVIIFAAEGGSSHQQLAHSAQVIADRRWYESLISGGLLRCRQFLDRFVHGNHIDVFYCFSDEAVWIAAGLVNAQKRPSRCLGGVYGPSDYGVGPSLLSFPRLAALFYPESHLYLHHLPESCRIYMNQALGDQLQAKSNCPVGGRVWPLPVDGDRFSSIQRKPEPGLIVSVGRLTPMKEYNLWMLDVVAQLRKAGMDVKWEVYGDGPYRHQMEERIRALSLQDHIELKGEIRYENLGEAFSRAQMFVGMGTALIEASFAGVPSIVAIVSESRSVSYGFINDLPEYTCGEIINHPVKPVADLIRHVWALGSEEYANLAAAHRLHASRFELTHLMGVFLKFVEQSPAMHGISRPEWCIPCAKLYRAVRKIMPARNAHWAAS